MEDKPIPPQLPRQKDGMPDSQVHTTTTDGKPPLRPSTAAPGHEKLDTAGICSNNSSQLLTGKSEIDDGFTNKENFTDTISFPYLLNDAPTSSKQKNPHVQEDGEDGERAIAMRSPRPISPASEAQHTGAVYNKVGEVGVCQMHRFSLYETASRYYLVGGDVVDRKFRILKIDRTVDSGDLSIAEDDIVYTKKEMNQLLNTVDDGNKASGGLKLKCSTWGLLGFVRFTGAYYMLVITKRSQPVAMIGGHYIYQVDGTELVSLTMSSSSRFKVDRDAEEARFIGILNNLDLSRSFYFSYSYDITHTLQHNILRERQAMQQGNADPSLRRWNSMFVWNHHLLDPATTALRNVYDWCLPIVHGFVDQASKNLLHVA